MNISKKSSEKKINILRRINTALSFSVFLLALYLIFYPFFPYISWKIKAHFDDSKGYVYEGSLAKKEGIPAKKLQPLPKDNRLVIPKIGINGTINEGPDKKALRKGIWRRPQTSTPDKGGNTVLISHRRMYKPSPDVFYNLKELKKGDKFIIFWEKKEYIYEIFFAETLPPSQTDIEKPTDESIVTLYTCTLDSKNRVVVKGKLTNL